MFFLGIFFLLFGCQTEERPHAPWQEIAGRNGLAVYHAQAPDSWVRVPLVVTEDTTRPLCEFNIGNAVRLVVHNFPGMDPIPPGAQVARWKKQFDALDSTQVSTQKEAWGGFAGLCLRATGMQKGQRIGVLAWAMQIAPEHRRVLEAQPGTEDARADYTIKASGPAEALQKYAKEISRFAHSFELIQDIPSP
jgi:hypothetical protein